ncbi:Pantothenate kinase [Tritonibacter multivorans]|uniref:Pantothenate kinase n=1 Tax=Tritonibacter multivorans TaxID=928856 RepID=A0A0P1G7Y6_9RHOB|nr:nucleoside/nucleotide kinase family protein [Tritonibacter multivorans]MDA7422296.1 nucleoside/nucleotide kinase family protein [Tritonibacter multivorans]CUH77755.1 Pantothenate kinase [Tritonibacter multivorans]SFD12482.1 fructokinase [Tritonibacter multivorans]
MTRALAELVLPRLPKGRRALVALAGAPGSGKSTLADRLARALTAAGRRAQVVPMDGFHLDNRLLDARDLRARKGAPDTFDLQGLSHLVARLRQDPQVIYPLFDRARDLAVAGAGEVAAECDTVVLEGNYLLFDQPGWRDLRAFWDVAIRLNVADAELRRRLVQRWLDHGLTKQDATARADANDMVNARLLAEHALPADLDWPLQGRQAGK